MNKKIFKKSFNSMRDVKQREQNEKERIKLYKGRQMKGERDK